MKLAKQPPHPARLVEFFEQTLGELGAVCERTWYDRLDVVAEGEAASLWRNDGQLHATTLHFPEPTEPGARDAAVQVFPGCPLTFRLVEALWRQRPPLFRACLQPGLETNSPPTTAVAQKVWQNQFGQRARMNPDDWRRVWHFTLIAVVRVAIQSVDQHWTTHRVAMAMSDGQRDVQLEQQLDGFAFVPYPGGPVPWMGLESVPWKDWLNRHVLEDLCDDLASIRKRQEHYLERELRRIDDYFDAYHQELAGRMGRQHKDEARARYQERLRATEAEHLRRRDDQVQRHEIRLLPYLDALLVTAEAAWQTAVSGLHGERTLEAVYVPRRRRWFR
ncbi:MAG TPA: hypothetical protein VL486_02470 [Verrucomicrobiae bacterium]|nr:hypothetical protein [Verrucomicrobiae bacterium]